MAFYVRKSGTGIQIKLVEEPILLGSAGTIAANREWVSKEDAFWILYADVLTNISLRELLDFHMARRKAATLAVYRVPDPKRCGIIIRGEDGIVEEFIEKPTVPTGNLAFSGVMIGTQEFVDAIPDRRPADIGFDVLPRLAGKMAAYEIDAYLLDIGTLQNYQEAQSKWPGLYQEHLEC